MAQEALGSGKGSNFFQSMEKRRALALTISVRWYSQALQEGGEKELLTDLVGKENRKWYGEETGGRILQGGIR